MAFWPRFRLQLNFTYFEGWPPFFLFFIPKRYLWAILPHFANLRIFHWAWHRFLREVPWAMHTTPTIFCDFPGRRCQAFQAGRHLDLNPFLRSFILLKVSSFTLTCYRPQRTSLIYTPLFQTRLFFSFTIYPFQLFISRPLSPPQAHPTTPCSSPRSPLGSPLPSSNLCFRTF